MIAGILLALQIAAAPTITAAPTNLVVRHADAIRTVPRIATVNGTYLRADLLAVALGGRAGLIPGGRYRITLGETQIELTEGVPFARIGQDVAPLVLPPLRSGQNFL